MSAAARARNAAGGGRLPGGTRNHATRRVTGTRALSTGGRQGFYFVRQQTPEVGVHMTPSGEAPSGVGKLGTPPISLAVANMLFAATRRPVRRLLMCPARRFR